MFKSISHTFEIMGQSWQVLKDEKGLLIFPLISGICCILVTASFLVPMIATDSWAPPGSELTLEDENTTYTEPTTSEYVAYYSKLFIFYFINYLIIIYFNSAIIGCAAMKFNGDDPTIADGFKIASCKFLPIITWALISATVGLILRMIEDRSKTVGKIVISIIGAVWTFVTFLVLPVIIIEDRHPFKAIKDSARMLKQTWGMQLTSNFSFGLIFFLLYIPAFILIILAVLSQNMAVMITIISIAVIYGILLGLVQSVLVVIFQTALYYHARGEQLEQQYFDNSVLQDSIYEK